MNTALNAICPYFTMFPLAFPYRILNRYGREGEAVLDPFSGRGTTLYAARMLGLSAFGIDSNPVAVAISEAKLANTYPNSVMRSAKGILSDCRNPKQVPNGPFWKLAFHENVLRTLCRLREGLMENCSSDSRRALRALILGALHGPLNKGEPSYFSNQCPRTFAPKPAYATEFWRKKRFIAPNVDVLRVIEERATRCFSSDEKSASGKAVKGDSQDPRSFQISKRVSWILTSPPYYGMRTYIPDQWLRGWFLGGPAAVDYSNVGQLAHTGRSVFTQGLKDVWNNCAKVAKAGCRIVVRFGAINDRDVDPVTLVKDSFQDTPWKLLTIRRAGSADKGKRQADQFLSVNEAIEEYDVWGSLAA